MILHFEETCDLCQESHLVSEYDYFFEGASELINGEEIPQPTFVTNKRTAKRYFKSEGWGYKRLCEFCPSCFAKLKKGFVVVDQFNHFCTDTGYYEKPIKECVQDRETAEEFAKITNDGETLKIQKALSFVVRSLSNEIKCDVVGFSKAHPEIKTILDLEGR